MTLTTRVQVADQRTASEKFSAGKSDSNVTNSTIEGTALMYDPEDPNTDADGTPIVYSDITGQQLSAEQIARMRCCGFATRSAISSSGHVDNLVGAQVRGARSLVVTGADSITFGQKYEVEYPDPNAAPATWRPLDQSHSQAKVPRGKIVPHVKPYTEGEGFAKSFIDVGTPSTRGQEISAVFASIGAEFIAQYLEDQPGAVASAAAARRASADAASKAIIDGLKTKLTRASTERTRRRALNMRTALKKLEFAYTKARASIVGTALGSGHPGSYIYATIDN